MALAAGLRPTLAYGVRSAGTVGGQFATDDAIRAVGLLTRVIADAVADGLMARSGVKTGDGEVGKELGAEEPMAEELPAVE